MPPRHASPSCIAVGAARVRLGQQRVRLGRHRARRAAMPQWKRLVDGESRMVGPVASRVQDCTLVDAESKMRALDPWSSWWRTPGPGVQLHDPPSIERLRGVFESELRARGGILKDAPGTWRAGGWWGLDLPDAPGTRAERRRAQTQLRRQPQVPLVAQGTPPGPRYWWCPGWVELPLEEQIPRDAWFFPKNVKKYTPDTWFVPLWSPSKQPGKDDPDCVQMVWRKRHLAECPGQPHLRGGTRALLARGG